jgi:hypothetical protein
LDPLVLRERVRHERPRNDVSALFANQEEQGKLLVPLTLLISGLLLGMIFVIIAGIVFAITGALQVVVVFQDHVCKIVAIAGFFTINMGVVKM